MVQSGILVERPKFEGTSLLTDVRFGVLGPVAVWRDAEVVPLTSATQRALLGVLLMAESRPLPAARLLALLRPHEAAGSARSWLQVVVSRLRTWLAKATDQAVTVVHRTDGYLLDVPPRQVDLGRFRALRTTALRADPDERAACWEQALDLWRGPVLADVAELLHDDTFTVHVEQLRVEAALGLADAALAAGTPLRALPQVGELTKAYPLDERLPAACALLLAGSGRQTEALRLIGRTRTRLVDELGIDIGEHLRDAHLRVLRQQALPATPVAAPERAAAVRWRGTRPDVAVLIGRDQEGAALLDSIGDRRLVTIVGPGGCGKTTLALHLADKLEARFADGVVVVDLASLTTAEDMVTALASLVEVSAPTVDQTRVALRHALAERHLLVVLDNCEHLIPECVLLTRYFIDHAPRVAVLATSRQPLGVVEEWIWQLETLEVPDEDAPVDPTTPAVALFLRRAAEAMPALTISDADLQVVGALCRRLDGLPLAIELAAARLRALPLAQLATRLARDFTLLGGAHRTLRSTIDWSYRLLTERERRLLARLSVFRDGFSVEAAEATCAAAPLSADDLLPTLIALIDKSLVLVRDSGEERRYRLLATVREFAQGQLTDADEVRDRHLDHWLAVGRELDAVPHYRERMTRARGLAADANNINAALDHGFGGPRAADAAELVVRLASFWLANRASLGSQETRLRQADEHSDRCTPEVRCLLLYRGASQLGLREDYVAARERMAAVLPEIAEHRPSEHREGTISLLTSGRFVLNPAAPQQVPAMLATVGEHLDGDEPSTALTAAAGVYTTWGRFSEAVELCERYAARAARRGTPFSISHQVVRTEVALGVGAMDEALAWSRLLTEQLATAGSPLEQEPARRAIGLVLLARGENERAREFLAESVAELERSYAPELARSAHLGTLLTEARRRTDDPVAARSTLAAALSQAVRRTHLRVGFTGALAAALVASDLGEAAAGRDLADRWDRLRRRVGLPIPAGFTDAATVLGLDPGASPADPTWVWRPEEVQDVIDRAHRWSVGGLGHVSLAPHQHH